MKQSKGDMTDNYCQDQIWEHYQVCQPESFHGNASRLAFLSKFVEDGTKVLNIGIGN
jgi:hypothetical protein